MFKRILFTSFIVVFSGVMFIACDVVKDLSKTLTNLQRLEFKLGDISNFRLSGINVNNKSKVSDFGLSDAAKLTAAFARKELPANFTLGLNAKNPNDGTGGYAATKAMITYIDWNLYLDDVKTINGNVSNNITVPGTGESVNIPINMGLDLYDFFGNKGYDRILNLALSIGGVKGTSSNVKLDIQPTVSTSLGPIKYPGRITVVNNQWKN